MGELVAFKLMGESCRINVWHFFIRLFRVYTFYSVICCLACIACLCFPSTLQRLTVWAAEVKILSNFIGTLPEDSPLKANCDIYFPTHPRRLASPNLFPR